MDGLLSSFLTAAQYEEQQTARRAANDIAMDSVSAMLTMRAMPEETDPPVSGGSLFEVTSTAARPATPRLDASTPQVSFRSPVEDMGSAPTSTAPRMTSTTATTDPNTTEALMKTMISLLEGVARTQATHSDRIATTEARTEHYSRDNSAGATERELLYGGDGPPPSGNPAPTPTKSASRQSMESPSNQSWFGVAQGRRGAFGVYPTWAEATFLVTGVPGAVHGKFATVTEAMDFVERYRRLMSLDEAGVADPTPVVAPIFNPLPGAPPPVARPPLSLSGPDPSMKKEDELFGIDIGSEVELQAALSPAVPVPIMKKLMATMLDVVALPGALVKSSDGNSDMQAVGSALEMLVDLKENGGGGARSDLQWRNVSRRALQ